MKLIIDIDEELYEDAKNTTYTGIDEYNAMNAIANGIPLEDIKAEINKEMMRRNYPNWSANIERTKGFQKALEIIDKHIGG